MVQIERANVVLDIPDDDLSYYLSMGYHVVVDKTEKREEVVAEKPKRTRKTKD